MIWGQCRNVETAISLFPLSFVPASHLLYWLEATLSLPRLPPRSITAKYWENKEILPVCLYDTVHIPNMLHSQELEGGKQAESTAARQERCQKLFRTRRPFSCSIIHGCHAGGALECVKSEVGADLVFQKWFHPTTKDSWRTKVSFSLPVWLSHCQALGFCKAPTERFLSGTDAL